MGYCLSSPTNTNTKTRPPETQAEIRGIRKSQISPPIIIGLSPSTSLTSKYSNDDERYYAPTPPRPPHIRLPAYSSYSQHSTPVAGIIPKPSFAIQPPTPQKDDDTTSDPGFRIGSDVDCKRQRDEELAEDISDVGIQIGKLIHALRAYSFHSAQTKTQMLGDLKGVIAALPGLPRGVVVRRVLGRVEREGRVCAGVVGCCGTEGEIRGVEGDRRDAGEEDEDGLGKGIEGLWEEFLMLRKKGKRDMARELGKGCILMRIFDLLSVLRAGSEELLALDLAISLCLRREFERVLGELRGFEDNSVEGGGDKKGKSGNGGANMQWRVLVIVQEKRREELERRMEVVKMGRGAVSVALLGVVEGLTEGGDWT
ncbi:hypothetical protein BKA65DRAFT_564978 [Rhexocercosporidium sp. MPI-PUGE-AT-0058]|nr:hypothetical protein BKA65DRAFT_564978 [Rhexocercosporidium sp. MPI-PUGE-AT-0058]